MLSGMWLSLVERFVRDEEVACSNHVIPMLEKERNPQSFQGVSLFLHYVIFNSGIIGTERKGCRNMNQIKKATEADAQEKGIAKQMMRFVFGILREKGEKVSIYW